jgi:glutamate synthase (NADPH/NADH) small chain
MGDDRGFIKYQRQTPAYRSIAERKGDFREIPMQMSKDELEIQGARCMDCGIPFCHTGCPLGNIIPDFNDLIYRDNWREAIDRLHATNNFPEFTGRICPAPCETACVLGITDPPVTIKNIEMAIIDHAWEQGWVTPEPPGFRTGKKVAVIGSGPAGLAAAQQLNRAGHEVVVFERDDRPGGLLMYGIPDFKMEKHHVYRRIEQMEAEGITFKCSVNVGNDPTGDQLLADFDAILLAIGATHPRDLTVPGSHLEGVHYAMEFLPQQNKVLAGDTIDNQILATGRDVIVIGGGDTGSDCIGTSVRQRAKSIVQFELLERPGEPGTDAGHNRDFPWPYYPMVFRISTSQEEGCERKFSINTKELIDDGNGHVRQLKTVEIEWYAEDNRPKMREIPGSEKLWDAGLVLLAMGFLGPEKPGVVEQLGVELDGRGNIIADDDYLTSVDKVFAAGDGRRGQSLVVWALAEGREAARGIDKFLIGKSDLPTLETRHESLPRFPMPLPGNTG